MIAETVFQTVEGADGQDSGSGEMLGSVTPLVSRLYNNTLLWLPMRGCLFVPSEASSVPMKRDA